MSTGYVSNKKLRSMSLKFLPIICRNSDITSKSITAHFALSSPTVNICSVMEDREGRVWVLYTVSHCAQWRAHAYEPDVEACKIKATAKQYISMLVSKCQSHTVPSVSGRHVHPSVGDIWPHSSAFCHSLWHRSTDLLGPLWASRFCRLGSSDLEQSATWSLRHVFVCCEFLKPT